MGKSTCAFRLGLQFTSPILGLLINGRNGNSPLLAALSLLLGWKNSFNECRIPDLELDDASPKKVFIRETIEKVVRLSYPHRIESSLPENYSVIFPRTPNFENPHAV